MSSIEVCSVKCKTDPSYLSLSLPDYKLILVKLGLAPPLININVTICHITHTYMYHTSYQYQQTKFHKSRTYRCGDIKKFTLSPAQEIHSKPRPLIYIHEINIELNRVHLLTMGNLSTKNRTGPCYPL